MCFPLYPADQVHHVPPVLPAQGRADDKSHAAYCNAITDFQTSFSFNVKRVAITNTFWFSFPSTATLTAGSIPIIGRLGYSSLSSLTQALVAVLHAMTIAFTP